MKNSKCLPNERRQLRDQLTRSCVFYPIKRDKGEQTTLGLIINVLRDKERESRSIRKQQPAKEQKRKQQTSKKKTAKVFNWKKLSSEDQKS
nr:uncharacterized protein LOC108007190 isoform X2 [Drosophila suzukii]